MSPKERQSHVKKKHRCYLCIGPHWRRDCPELSTSSCGKCQGKHNTLLHLPNKDKNKGNNAENNQKRNDFKKDSEKTSVNVGIVGANERQSDETATVPIMALEAVQYENGRVKKIVPFYALLDTGAERTLCTKFLAKKLYGWDPTEKSELQFLEGDPKTYGCMKRPIHLKLSASTNVIPMQEVIFLDTKLPFSGGIPDTNVLQKHKASHAKFPIIAGNRRIDMIMGAPHINKFGIFFNTKWAETSSGGPKVGINQLGEIWWGLKEDEKRTPYIRIVRCLHVSQTPMLESHVENQIKKMVQCTHGIDSTEAHATCPASVKRSKSTH